MGTILEAMIRAGLRSRWSFPIECRGLDLAFGAGIETLLVSREEFGGFAKSFDRGDFTEELTSALKMRDIDLIAMAGFGTIVTAPFHVAYPGRVLNTHPSLLPAFKGWHAVSQAWSPVRPRPVARSTSPPRRSTTDRSSPNAGCRSSRRHRRHCTNGSSWWNGSVPAGGR